MKSRTTALWLSFHRAIPVRVSYARARSPRQKKGYNIERAITPLLQPMIGTVEGIYQNGQIELSELPQNMSDRTQVLVIFLEPGKVDPNQLRQLIDKLETIAGIQQGFEELNAGQTQPIGNFIQEMQQKYDISG